MFSRFLKHRLWLAIAACFLAALSQTNAQTTECTGLNLTLNDGKTTYNRGESVNYTYTCVPGGYAAYIGIQVVKPDGTATTYNYANNIHTSTMGFETSNFTPGNYILRACFNAECSIVPTSAPFTVAAATVATGNVCSSAGSYGCASDGNSQFYCNPSTNKWQFSQYCSTSHRTCNGSSGMCQAICGDGICGIYETYTDCAGSNDCPIPACTKLKVTLANNKTAYSKGDDVSYTFSCETPAGAPAANAIMKLVKPDGAVSTLLSVSGATSLSQSYGFPTTDFSAGAYTLKACWEDACPAASTGVVAFTVSAPAPSDSSLIGYWKFDGNGNNEVPGKPNAAAVVSAVFNSNGGKFNGYGYVSSASDYFRVPYHSAYDLPETLTVEFWFRQRSNQGFNQNLVYKGNPTNNYNFNIFRYLWNQYNNGAVITGYTDANTGYWTQTSNPNEPPHNTWHHIAFTKGSSGSAYYIDGAPIHSQILVSSARTPASDIIIGDSAVDTDFDDLKIYNRALSAGEVLTESGFPAPASPPTPTPGAGAPEPLNDEPGVWAQVDIATGQILTAAICTRAVCGINGEYHGYVPPSSWSIGSVWWPTSKRYIWQVPGQAGYGSGAFNFSTYIFTVAGGTIYNGVFTPTAAPATPTTTPAAPPVTPTPPSPTPPTTPVTPPPALPTPPASSVTSSLPLPPTTPPSTTTPEQITPPTTPPPAQKWDSRQARLMESQKKAILRELKDMERYYKRAKGNEAALADISALRNKINDFKPKDSSAFETMQNLQDELNVLRLDYLELTEREAQFTRAKQSMKSLEQFLAPFKEKVKKIERAKGVVAQSFKDALADAQEFIKRVRAAKNYEEIQDIMDQERFADLGTRINEYLPELERLTYLPDVLRIINKQTTEAQRLIKAATASARRLGIDATEEIQEMKNLLAAMREGAAALKTEAAAIDDLPGYVQENISDKLDDLRQLADHISAVANVRQYVNKTAADIKKYAKRVSQLEKEGESMSFAYDLLDDLKSNLEELRPLAAKRLNIDTADMIIDYLRAMADARGQLEEIINVVSPDVLEQQLQRLFQTSGKEYKPMEAVMPTAAIQ